ncbi:MAG: hypothetical protein Q4F75_07655 [Pseudomonadota bacterium]|nr:hypothetical protein [Pseudomonadota bacterium]
MRNIQNLIRKFFMIPMAALLILCCTNVYAADDVTNYTREELENNLRNDLQDSYQKSQTAQAAIDAANKEKEQIMSDYLGAIDKAKTQVYNGDITDAEYKQLLKDLEKESKDKTKEADKKIKEQQKIVDDFSKEYEKGMKEINKTLEKQEKAAAKAEKEQNKLADKAEKKSEQLAAALAECESMAANPATRQACAEKAKKKYGLTDEQQTALDNRQAAEEAAKQQALQDALNASMEEEEPEELPLPGVEKTEGSDGDPNKAIGTGGNADSANGTTPGLKGVCANAGSGKTKVFAQIACKALMFLIDLRVIAYVISGFGMVAFAYAAVFNKINWKHFSQIAIGLFLLAMIGPFISYFTGDKTVEVNLQYGNYLGGNYNPINGTGGGADIDGGELPEVAVTAQKKKWSLKDLKGSIQSGLDMARGAYNTVQGVKSTINTVKNNADIIKNAVTNNSGGLDGILGAVGNISGAMNNIGYAAQTGMNSTLGGIGKVADNAQDMVATNQQRNINANERAENGSSNAISGWINSEQGGGALSGIVSDANNAINKGATAAGQATTAGHEGQKIGGGGALGDVVGGIFGAGQAVVGGMDASEQMKKEKEIEAQRQKELEEKKKQEEAAKNAPPPKNKLFDN